MLRTLTTLSIGFLLVGCGDKELEDSAVEAEEQLEDSAESPEDETSEESEEESEGGDE
tara:strand:- start:271 stop:444 length:174 start_codon:yes stop_codon:yes gene_type:complete